MNLRADALDWLGRASGAAGAPLRVERMRGSTSSSLFRVERFRGDSPERFVLRVLDNREWLADEPDLARHEAAALVEASAPACLRRGSWRIADRRYGVRRAGGLDVIPGRQR